MMVLATEDESAEGSELRRMQRDQERERRRMRDRQRRQSMTLEQRERHLARRRRNYQLRRLRAGSTSTKPDSTTISHESGGEIVISNDHDQAVNSASEAISPQEDDHGANLNRIGFEKLNSEFLQSIGSDILARRTVNVTKRLRLSHLRCLARSVNRCGGGVGGIHGKEEAVLVSKKDADTTLQFGDHDSSRLPSGLRLNRIKRLARGLSAVEDEINGHRVSHQAEQNRVVSGGEHKFGQTKHC